MTKHRAPLTIDAALARVAGQLPGGWADMATATERSESLVRAWGDPERREQIPICDAITLDLAYRAAGGDGAPLFETYAWQLDQAGVFRFSDEIALGRIAAEAIREGGEANAALVLAAQPGSTDRERREAAREVKQALAALNRSLPMLEGADLAKGPAQERETGPPA